MLRSGWIVLLLAGCADVPGGKDGDTSDPEEGVPDPTVESLVFTLDATASGAGDAVGYTLEAVYTDDAREPVGGAIASDLEPGLAVDATLLTATVAGAHTLTATAEIDGEAFSATATLDVAAGPIAGLSLSLDPATVGPGEPALAAVVAADAWGNELDGAATTFVAEGLTMDGWSASGTTAGVWTVTATLDGTSDEATLVVNPGADASLVLSLDPTTGLDPGGSSVATVVIADAWGNATESAWALSVEGGSATIAGASVTFDSDGAYTVTATSGTLSDSVGPIVVDSSGPLLVVETPERAGWAGDAVTVSGTAIDELSGVVSLTVDGASSPVDADGTFSSDLELDFGMNVLETIAIDGDANTTSDLRAVLSGDVLALGAPEADGLVVRLNEGAGGLDALTEGVGDLVAPADVLAELPSPLYSDTASTCYVLFGRTYCTDYTLEFTVTDLDWASTDVTLDPKSDGTILLTFTITDPVADWTSSGEVAGSNYNSTGTATADSLVVSAEMTLSIVDGNVVAEIAEPDTTLTNLDLGLPSWANTVLGMTGYDLEADVEDQLAAAVSGMVADQVPAAIADGLGELTVTEDLAVGDSIATLTATPSTIEVDETGVTLALATVLSLDTWRLDHSADGSLEYGYSQPEWTGSPGALIGFSADFLNQIFYAAWGGGALSMEATDEDLGVDMSVISLFLTGLTDLVIVVDPLLPPVAVPTPSASSPFDLQTGDMLISMYDGDASEPVVYQVYVSMVAPMDIATSGSALTTSIGAPAVWVDVVTAPDGTDETALEAVLELLLPTLLSSGISSLGDVPLPDLAGYSLSGAAASTGGAESGYILVGGDLTGS